MAEKKAKKETAAAKPAAAAKKAPAKKEAAQKEAAKKPAKPAAAKQQPAAAAAAPERRFLGPVEEMEHLLEQLWRRPQMPSWLGRFKLPELMGEISPSIDIFEEGGNVVIKAEVPGIKRDELEITLTEDTVCIAGHKKSEEKVKRENFYRVERSFGSFTRRLRLPAPVLTDKAKASFRDGVLEIVIPKATVAPVSVRTVNVE